jgi:pyruvate dehydrogenase E2 component (dihydrolipoamide acetyltransferase)
MPTEIYLVKVGMNMTEGVVEEWYVPDGGTVEKGELLYRLETEKVNLDVDADASGTVKHLVAEGVTMKPGDVVGYIYAPGEAVPDELPGPGEGATATPPPSPSPEPNGATQTQPAAADGERILSSPAARRLAGELGVDIAGLVGSGPGGRIVEADVQAAADRGAAPAAVPEPMTRGEAPPSSPIARRLARELGIDIATVTGSGPNGRITREDVEAAAGQTEAAGTAGGAAPAPAVSMAAAARADRTVPVKGMRRTIAARMHESLQTMAQLTMDMDVVMDAAVDLRNRLVEAWEPEGVRPTYTDLVIAAVAKALAKHPQMNAVFGETEITLLGEINVGLAVALDDGLIVPVVRAADTLPLAALARESARLAAAARDGTLTVDDLQGGTFTVSPLGMFGVDAFTPIINAPQVGILGINRIRDDIAWDEDRPVRQRRMRLSLTWDHRALDGAPAARFLAEVRDLLESPYRLLA